MQGTARNPPPSHTRRLQLQPWHHHLHHTQQRVTSTRSRVLLCNAVIQIGSQTILATIALSAGRNFVGRCAATTAGEARAAPRLSSPLADCVPQVLRRGHVRRLRSRAPARARLRQRAVLRRMPLVLRFSRYGQLYHAHAAACAADRVYVAVLAAAPSAPLLFVIRLMFVCTVCQMAVLSTWCAPSPQVAGNAPYFY